LENEINTIKKDERKMTERGKGMRNEISKERQKERQMEEERRRENERKT
jgi:hypothetical protein